jgi:ribonuclease HI
MEMGRPLPDVDLWQDLDALTRLHTIHDKWIKGIQGT